MKIVQDMRQALYKLVGNTVARDGLAVGERDQPKGQKVVKADRFVANAVLLANCR